MNVFGSILESASLSVNPGVRLLSVSVLASICARNSTFCQSTRVGIKSHVVTALD